MIQSELLTALKDKQDTLKSQISELTTCVLLTNIRNSSNIREVLVGQFDRIKEIVINNDNITVQIQSDDNRFVHDAVISNLNSPYISEFKYDPKITWSSGSAKKESITMISYIKVIAFVLSEISKTDSTFNDLIKKSFGDVWEKNNKLSVLRNELNQTMTNISREELRIKKEIFYSTFKLGNFYYTTSVSNGRITYTIYHINKMSPKTLLMSSARTVNGLEVFDGLKAGYYGTRRIRITDIYSVLQNCILLDKSEFTEVVTNNKFKYGIELIRRNWNETYVRDIKLLCQKLLEAGVTTERVPSNAVLQYISKWRHYVLEQNKTVEQPRVVVVEPRVVGGFATRTR